ncbi:U4/U6 x U5 tri-snRNP complex subunit Prp1 [Tilletia horrida]|nr:U4/U6 x U5 tri-snRNP complex subunit Prp1 [Tilletia horrida]
MASDKLAFLRMEAPAGYVAGLGRGASGFTTRSDIGPAREGPSAETIAAARARRGEDDEEDGGLGEEADPAQFQDPDNETGLFAGTVYERDDEEADAIWEGVDQQMLERRRKKREAKEQAEKEEQLAKRPKIQAQFADLKRGLTSISETEWEALPEAQNLTGKRRKAAEKREARDTRGFAVPDSVLLGARDKNAVESSLSADQMAEGSSSSIGDLVGGTVTSLTEIGEARNKIFEHQLDRASTSAAGSSGLSSTIDPKGYLTELSSVAIKSNAEIGDIKKARSLMESVIKTNPKHAPGWIALARLEEHAGKMAVARKVIAQGCDQCPKSEDIWLENARLNTNDNAKIVLAKAVQHLSQSVNIWLKATELENDPESKKRVLQKSLEYVPDSVKLWKELVNLQDSHEDAKILLAGAVEAIPASVELWLALARLSTPKEATGVLNKARKTIPTSHEIWIAALRLMEQSGEAESRLNVTMKRAVESLKKNGAVLSREQWLKEAEQVEKEGSPLTCAAIVKATIHLDIEEEDRRTVWVEDAQAALEKGHVETARAILAHTLEEFPDRQAIWRQAADLEKAHGTQETLEGVLEKAVTFCPKAEVLWLMYAKEKWTHHDVDGARQVLARAFERNLGSEEISLAASKLEAENGQKQAAQRLLEVARSEVGSARVWMKSAAFERNEGRLQASLALVNEALKKFPNSSKLHMMKGQLVEATVSKDPGERIRAAREAFAQGVRACPASVPLWLLSSRLEERAGITIRARALLEKARSLNPKNDELWAESVGVEERAGSTAQAKALLNRALQECPTSGLLWAHAILAEPKATRKGRSADALKKTGDNAMVISVVARGFWEDRKIEMARKWFDRATKANPDWGDGWAWWRKFEKEHGSAETVEQVTLRTEKAEPHHGALWQAVSKDPAHPGRSTREILDEVEKRLR